jgi:hypothetical protein
MGMYLISRALRRAPASQCARASQKRAIRIHQLLVNLVAGAMFAPPGQGGVGPSVRMGHRTLWASTSVGASILTAYTEKTYATRVYAEPDN